ncbi:MAG: hypothetical protein KGR25_00065 [Chloroflexi bacterium]|nr:hypothetical protein [Chloroflexota bacterium]
MKRGTGRHDKVLEFACELGVPVYAAVGILNLLWEWAAESKPRGDIGRASNRVIATMAGWPTEDSDRLVEMLVKSKLVDEIEGEDRLYIHDWHDHCDNGVHTWLGRRGLCFANGNPPSTNHLRSDERKLIEAKYGHLLDSSKKGPKKVQGKSNQKTCARMDGTAPAPAPVRDGSVQNDSCPDPAIAGRDRPPAIGWGSSAGWSGLTPEHRKVWEAAYPSVSIDGELAKAHAWLLANPTRAGKRNWAKFLNGWMGRAHEGSGNGRTTGQSRNGYQTPTAAATDRRRERAEREFDQTLDLPVIRFQAGGRRDAGADGQGETRNAI